MNWWEYLILVNVYLLLFFGFYALLLKKETFFQLNRLYLVSAALLSFIIPLIQSNWVKNLFITQTVHARIYGSPVLIYQYKPIGHTPLSIGELLAIIYLVGVGILIIRFAAQLISLRKIISQPAPAAPYTFFNKVNLDENINERDIIATHEQVHARQLHSADVLIIEAVMIVNWFNPVVYFYRFAVKHIHEFIADSYTLKNGADKVDYALLLLSQTFNAPQHQLVSNFFNRSLLKQRIMMLQKNRSARIKLIKYGLSVPMFIIMLILAAATVNNSKAVTRVNIFATKVFSLPADKSALLKLTEIKLLPLPDKTPGTAGLKTKIGIGNKKIDSAIRLEMNAEQTREESFAANVKNDTAFKSGSNELFTAVEIEPSFPGFGQYLAKELRYPETDRENKIQGKVYLQFVVEKDGSVDNIQVLRAPDQTLADEAVRVLSSSPKWNPGIQNGRTVRTQFTVPISFTLNQDEDKPVTVSPGTKGTVTDVVITGYAMKPDTAKPLLKSGHNFFDAPSFGALIIIDGKQKTYDDMKLLNANKIKNISILKDKDAIKLYGDAAKNGVIVVTTKK
jgi:TonB family protein